MNYRIPGLPSFALCGLFLPFLHLCTPVVADTLELKNGTRVEGEVLGFDGRVLKIRSQIGAGSAEVPYPVELVGKLHLAAKPDLTAALSNPVSEVAPLLEGYWKAREAFLSLPETDTGRVGLAYAKALLAGQKKKDAQTALAVLETIRGKDWNAPNRDEAVRLRLTALAATGKIDQAMEEAARMQDVAGEDEIALAQARVRASLVKADLAWKRLLKLEGDWPKWTEMPEQRAEHDRLRHEALDGFVFAATFHPELKDLVSEGLCKAAEASHHLGETAAALAWAREVIDFYPVPEFQVRVQRILQKIPPEKKTQTP